MEYRVAPGIHCSWTISTEVSQASAKLENLWVSDELKCKENSDRSLSIEDIFDSDVS